MFSREKYKVYIEHLSLARKHIERAEKIIQVSDDRFMLVQEEIARVYCADIEDGLEEFREDGH